MDAMMEKIKALVRAGGNKENTPSPRANSATNDDGNKCSKAKKHHRPHCKKMVIHKPKNCFKLKANKEKHFKGWKSVFTLA
jgi:hypothetical protein